MSGRVIFDSTFLLLLFDAKAKVPLHPDTGRAVDLAKERIDGLVKVFEKSRTKICIPTPALSELLVGAGSNLNDYINTVSANSGFRVLPFDEKAAVECALMGSKDLKRGEEKDKAVTYAKLKFDRQIIAISISENIDTIYSDDAHLAKIAARYDIKVIRIHEVDIPEEAKQGNLSLES